MCRFCLFYMKIFNRRCSARASRSNFRRMCHKKKKKKKKKNPHFAKNSPPAPIFYAFSMQKHAPRIILTPNNPHFRPKTPRKRPQNGQKWLWHRYLNYTRQLRFDDKPDYACVEIENLLGKGGVLGGFAEKNWRFGAFWDVFYG
jgi:hypothetical protein